jgi:MYXO-CTERM domain-containing protein
MRIAADGGISRVGIGQTSCVAASRPTPSLVPVGAFALGGLVLVVFLRRQGGAPAAESAGAAPVADPELERIIDDELGNPAP